MKKLDVAGPLLGGIGKASLERVERDTRYDARSFKPASKEKDINAGIRQILQLDGWHVFNMETVWNKEYRKGTGEVGMPDMLAIRYRDHPNAMDSDFIKSCASVLWIEGKTPKGRTGVHQLAWHAVERGRGALVWRANADFEASVEGFKRHYEQSGLCRRKLE